jgi:predicted flap endonuclease-1-like 5' DNA nuclease
MFEKVSMFSSKDEKVSWWWLGVVMGVLTALGIWWWLVIKNKKTRQEITSLVKRGNSQLVPLPIEEIPLGEMPVIDMTQEDPSLSADETAASPSESPPEPDDLTRIEGIGPKINATLQAAGIQTFAQLADQEPAAIKQILVDGGIRIGYPRTWPEQAALAAKADWAALEELQSGLQAGRRIS